MGGRWETNKKGGTAAPGRQNNVCKGPGGAATVAAGVERLVGIHRKGMVGPGESGREPREDFDREHCCCVLRVVY